LRVAEDLNMLERLPMLHRELATPLVAATTIVTLAKRPTRSEYPSGRRDPAGQHRYSTAERYGVTGTATRGWGPPTPGVQASWWEPPASSASLTGSESGHNFYRFWHPLKRLAALAEPEPLTNILQRALRTGAFTLDTTITIALFGSRSFGRLDEVGLSPDQIHLEDLAVGPDRYSPAELLVLTMAGDGSLAFSMKDVEQLGRRISRGAEAEDSQAEDEFVRWGKERWRALTASGGRGRRGRGN
jgi:hypothetical protein